MRVSFVTTVLNEEKTVHDLLVSLNNQTVPADEIIIVDAGSVDGTRGEINAFKKKLKRGRLTLYIKKGNRSVGRNYGIKKANGQIIVVSDVGCILHKKWVENITKPFQKKDTDVVAGYYKPIANSIFEKCLATYTCYPEDKINKNFLPSSRSISFKKKAWQEVNGYPEHLDTCEDLIFARNLKKAGFNFVVRKNALVYWPQRKNIVEAALQFYSYATGDGYARYIRLQFPFLFGRYIVGGILLLLSLLTSNFYFLYILMVFVFLYIAWSIQKNYKYVNSPYAIIFLPVLQIVSDIAVILGTTIGLIRSIKKH